MLLNPILEIMDNRFINPIVYGISKFFFLIIAASAWKSKKSYFLNASYYLYYSLYSFKVFESTRMLGISCFLKYICCWEPSGLTPNAVLRNLVGLVLTIKLMFEFILWNNLSCFTFFFFLLLYYQHNTCKN